jgi:hypothetical protein
MILVRQFLTSKEYFSKVKKRRNERLPNGKTLK